MQANDHPRGNSLANARYSMYFRLLDRPLLGDMYIRLRSRLRPNLVTRETDLVIDGFPRSANTYSRTAFEIANGQQYTLSTHLHTPRSIRKGLELECPSVVLIRDPRDAVVSLVHLLPGMKIETAFRRYVQFYSALMDVRGDVVVAPFSEVKADFGKVIQRTNERFGTSFRGPGGDQASRDAALSRSGVAARLRSYEGSSPVRHTTGQVLQDLTPPERYAMEVAVETFHEFTAR